MHVLPKSIQTRESSESSNSHNIPSKNRRSAALPPVPWWDVVSRPGADAFLAVDNLGFPGAAMVYLAAHVWLLQRVGDGVGGGLGNWVGAG